MRYEEWEPWYRQILADFGFDRGRDEAAAGGLARALDHLPYRPDDAWRELEELFRGRPAIVLGASDGAPTALAGAPKDHRLVCADGATTAAQEVGRRPQLIVTDLDGRIEDEVEACLRGSYVAIHAHGDNEPAVREWLAEFPPRRVVGTCQCEPVPPLRNFGGFTDGDRACFVAAGLGASSVLPLGFDYDGKVGKYSGSFDPATKHRKLAWAKRLLDELRRSGFRVES